MPQRLGVADIGELFSVGDKISISSSMKEACVFNFMAT